MFVDLDSIEPKEIVEGFTAKFTHAEKMTVAHWDIKAGSKLPEHAHVHEQVSIVIKGEFELSMEGKKRTCRSGDIAVIPSNVTHTGEAIVDCVIIDVFSPVREDYRKKFG